MSNPGLNPKLAPKIDILRDIGLPSLRRRSRNFAHQLRILIQSFPSRQILVSSTHDVGIARIVHLYTPYESMCVRRTTDIQVLSLSIEGGMNMYYLFLLEWVPVAPRCDLAVGADAG